MDAEEVLNLLDFYWFNQEIIRKKPISPTLETPSLEIPKAEPPKPACQISSLPSRHVRSYSDHQFSSKSISSVLSDFESPKSVLFTHKLQTILSGKQVIIPKKEEEEAEEEEEEEVFNHLISQRASTKKIMMAAGRKRRNRGSSRSLSDLEFDELKGFMDLGFVFSEEDKNSSTLVSMIPGLQRLGNKRLEGDESVVDHDQGLVPRPYLSEAWDVFDQRKEENQLMNWKIPALRSEINMKDHLRFWAHTVASTVR